MCAADWQYMREDIMHTISWKLAFARLASVVFLLVGPLLAPVSPSTPVALAQPEGPEIDVAMEEPPPPEPQRLPNGASPQAITADTYWTTEVIDPGSGVGLFSSLTIDPSDDLHAGYYETTGATLRYAVFTDTAWVTTTVDAVADVGQYASIALDSNDQPRISYYDATNTALRYARKEAGWIPSQADNTASVGQYTSLAFDGTTPLISYYDATSSTLKLAQYDTVAREWVSETVDTGPDVGQYTAIDVARYPHIIYYDAGNDQLKYVKGTSSGWDFSDGPVNHSGGGGRFTSLALDSGIHPHVSYFSSLDKVVYAYHGGTAWLTTTIATAGSEATMHTAIAVDADDVPHIAYTDNVGLGHLYYAYLDGTTWVTETIESANVEGYPSIALDFDGLPHITCQATDGLKHAWLRPCAAPDLLDLSGPGTVEVGTKPTFTATVLPPTTTVPITFTWTYPGWEDDVVDVAATTEMTLSFWVNQVGTHPLTVTAETQCGHLATMVRNVAVEEVVRPDIYFNTVWQEEGETYYQLWNIGQITATAGYTIVLAVDGSPVATAVVPQDIGPNQALDGAFGHTWGCSGDSDVISATVDAGGLVDEEDETNNTEQDTWYCDTTAPVFTAGPTATLVTSTTAVIEWETDELSDSSVSYGTTAGEYDHSEYDPTDTLHHQVTLTGLSPGTIYHYRIRSSDTGPIGYQSFAEGFYFATSPPTYVPPLEFNTDVVQLQPDLDVYAVDATFTDTTDVSHVVFVYTDALSKTHRLGTAYTPDRDGRYRVYVNPYSLGMAPDTFFSPDQQIETEAFSLAELGYARVDLFEPLRDEVPVDLEINAPAPNHTIYFYGSTVPAGQLLDVMVYAAEYEWQCDWNTIDGIPSGAPECGDVAVSVDHVDLVLNGQVLGEFTLGGDSFHHYYALDLSSWLPGDYTFTVRAHDSTGGIHTAQVVVSLVQREPSIMLQRTVTPMGHYYHVELTVENQAGATGDARISRIVDNADGFQVADDVTMNYATSSHYDPVDNVLHRHDIVIDFYSMASESYYELAPGDSILVEYDLVPVLAEAPVAIYRLGHDVVVAHHGGDQGDDEQEPFSLPTEVDLWGARQRIAQADYVLVTHPGNLYDRYQDDDVDELLPVMAALAVEQQGVLGYLASDDPRDTFDALIEPGGDWANQLHPDFDLFGGGYVLIVGETEIVPAWEEQLNANTVVSLSDQRYANAAESDVPHHVVGRIVGDSAAELIVPLRNVATMLQGTSSLTFDHSHAFLLSGTGTGQSWVAAQNDKFEGMLTAQGVGNITRIDGRQYYFVDSYAYDFDTLDAFAAGDVDGDGWAEMIIADVSADTITIVGHDGSPEGSFDRPEFNDTFEMGDRLAVADMTGNGVEEIIIGDRSSGKVWLYDDGGFLVNFADVGFTGGEMAVGDVNDDGEKEYVVYPLWDDTIYGYAQDGTLLYSFPRAHNLEAFLTVADVITDIAGSEGAEIVLADDAQDRIFFYNDGGTELYAFEYPVYSGDILASGNVSSDGLDEVLFGDVDTDTIFFLRWDSGDQEVTWGWDHPYLPTLVSGSGVAAGNVSGDGVEEFLVADRVNDELLIADGDYCYRLGDAVAASDGLNDADLLIYSGHGSPDGWGCGMNVARAPFDFGTAAPLALGLTCLSGNYEGNMDAAFPETVMADNAIGYIGATEVAGGAAFDGGETFLDLWGDGHSLGKSLFFAETIRWLEDYESYRYWVYEYNYYGDPKFGAVTPPPGRGILRATVAASTTIHVDVPTYTVTQHATFDHAEIPGGDVILAEGEYAIPYWVATFDYPAGQVVQDVTLVSRTGLVTETGLSLPVAVPETHPNGTGNTLELAPAPSAVDDGWVPTRTLQYEWTTHFNPDGTSTLVLTIYPFHYHPLRTAVEFYGDFTFDVDLFTSTGSAEALTTTATAYAQGDTVQATLWVSHTGPAQDVVASAVVRDIQGDFVAGLPLHQLHDLEGWGSLDLAWDSSGVAPGRYALEVELRDLQGHLLDRTATGFQLGITSAQVTDLIATPDFFRPGDTVDITMTLTNTGSLSLTGEAVIQIQVIGGLTTTATFTHTVSDLLPGAGIDLNDVWNTTGVTADDYRIIGYVKYDSRSTNTAAAYVTARRRIYLPLVLRE
jgi:hypothetical protein